MKDLPHHPPSGVIRFAASAMVLLASAGCATLEEFIADDWPEEPVEIAEDAAFPEEAPAATIEPEAPAAEPVFEIKPVEPPRTPLKDVLLEALKSPEREKQRYVVKSGDTLGAIADRHKVTLSMLKWANKLKSDRIKIGQKLVIPPSTLRIQIDKSDNRLKLFDGKKLVRAYPVATGNQGVTPKGKYTVANRLIQPTWYWEGRAYTKDDPDYPLGTRWLGLSKKGYGIHGTNEPDSIGKQLSHGCVRMFNEDVEELFDVIAVGTEVTIVE